jgi:hypothetical protein
VACSGPAGAGSPYGDFELIDRRFHVRDGEWRLSEGRERGFWENDGEFPSSETFPT